MRQKRMKKVLSYLLACCLLAGMLPCMEGSMFASAAEANMIESEAELKAAITSAPKGQLANLEDKGTVLLSWHFLKYVIYFFYTEEILNL